MRQPWATALLCLLAAACAPAQRKAAKEIKPMNGDVQLESKIEAGEGGVKIAYTLTNLSGGPILVFDRMWDNEKGAIDPNWAYVEIRGGRALVKRMMENPPQGLRVSEPKVPYGREVAPGAKAEGTIALAAPLTERGAYDSFTHTSKQFADAPVSAIGFALGYAPKPANLAPAFQPVELNGEKLLLLDRAHVATIQKTATGEPAAVPLTAKVKQ
ncbi:MAG: hypothetical protein J0L64_06820 [Acidobacteria bacterium]|nr:hypothetical protein [Acidobacteriota bacterium]